MLDHDTLAASASTSAPCLRHRSSTLKPPKRPLRPQIPPTPTTPPHPTGLRAHFAQLLPRHAVFLARISVHELNNVPLVRGEFGVRWKVKGVKHSGKVKGKAKAKGKPPTPGSSKGKGRERESDIDNASLIDVSTSISDTHSIAASSSTHSHSHEHASLGSARGRPTGPRTQTYPLNIPTLVISSNSSAPAPVISRNVSGTSIISSALSSASHSTHPNLHLPAHYLSVEWYPQFQAYSSTPSLASQGSPQSHALSLADTPPPDGYTPAKGQTPFVGLKDHNVLWDQTLDFIVQMGLARETGELDECPVTLIVMQRVVPGDPDAPRNPRVGSIYLNLAQYVGAGAVTRRYLLRQSKTNATLKLTIQLEHAGGASSYIAPPLPKAEILSGVAGILDSDTYRNCPSALGLYSSSSGSSDSLSASDGEQGQGPTGQAKAHVRQRRTKNHKKKPFDPSKLPDIRGPRATEKLIDAIFNPAPVTSPTRVTPFTFLVEEGAYEGGDQASLERQHDSDGKFTFVDIHGNTSLEERELDQESDYQSARSGGSVLLPTDDGEQHPLRSKRSLRSIGSRLGLRAGNTTNEEAAVSSAVDVSTSTMEKRMWWQKVLHPV